MSTNISNQDGISKRNKRGLQLKPELVLKFDKKHNFLCGCFIVILKAQINDSPEMK